MSDRIKEWSTYFSIHCHLPAAAIRDLFDEIERLRAIKAKWVIRCGVADAEIERLRVALEDFMAFGIGACADAHGTYTAKISKEYEALKYKHREALQGG